MKRALGLIVIALSTSGCSLGMGYPHVGEVSAGRSEIDHRVCIEDAKGTCKEVIVAKTEEPVLSYQGFTILYPAAGAAWVKEGTSGASPELRGEGGIEYLRGRGGVAYGVRASVIGEGDTRVLTPVTGLGYVAVTRRLSLHGGLGYVPLISYGGTIVAPSSVARGLVGTEVVLMRRYNGGFALRTELDNSSALGSGRAYRSTGLTTSLALQF